MDVFFYWKSFDDDIKARRIGWLQSERPKLAEMQKRSPDYIWAFRTPKGHKGSLQLLARLKWVDKPSVPLPKPKVASVVYYDPSAAESVVFTDSFTEANITAITLLLRKQFPHAFKGNFQGDNGIHALEADFLFHLRKLSKLFATVPFADLLDAPDTPL